MCFFTKAKRPDIAIKTKMNVCIAYSSYSPDLAPGEYYLFAYVQITLTRKRLWLE